jgi:hypothetical protein
VEARSGALEPDRKSSQHFQTFSNLLKMIHFPSWPGLFPAIHVVSLADTAKTWMAGNKPGHDELSGESPILLCYF